MKTKTKDNIATVVGSIVLCVLVLVLLYLLYLYGVNIYDLVQMVRNDTGTTAMVILRCAGIFFFPLGMILGYN